MTQPGSLGSNAPRRGDWIGRKLAELERMIRQIGVVTAAVFGIPAGGTATQILTKIDATDYHVAWQDPPSIPLGSSPVLLIDLNVNALTVGGGQITLNSIPVAVIAGLSVNSIFALELDCTATGTGTVTVTFFYGALQVGPTVQVPFVAGPVHIPVDDFLIGLTTSNTFSAKAQVTSGSGTLSVPGNGSHAYILGTGIAGGSLTTSPTVTIAEAVAYLSSVTDAVSAATQTPVDGSPAAESVLTTPAGVSSDTVTAVTTP